jgi:hypothetical protein
MWYITPSAFWDWGLPVEQRLGVLAGLLLFAVVWTKYVASKAPPGILRLIAVLPAVAVNLFSPTLFNFYNEVPIRVFCVFALGWITSFKVGGGPRGVGGAEGLGDPF